MNNKRKIKYLRRALLAFFLIIITFEAYLHQVKGGGQSPSIHALCPYGGIESLYSLIFSGTFIQKIFIGTMTLLVITMVLSIIFRRSFCGFICPFGALQEFFGIVGKKIFGKKFTIPAVIDKPLRYLKYIVLIITILFAWKNSGLWIAPYDPWAAYGHITEGFDTLTGEYLIGTAILIIVLIGSMLYDRFFCKYLCPMGAVYGILSKISPSKIVRNEDKCVNCSICTQKCPMNIDVAKADKVTSAECIGCQICLLSCPKNDALQYKVANKTVKPIVITILVIIVFFGGILISKASGVFDVLPNKITTESKFKAEDIKGYMTIKEVSIGTGIEINEVYRILKIPKSVSEDTKLKDLKNYISDFEVETAKEKLEQK